MRFFLRRLLQLVVTLFAVSVLTFLSIQLLGDPLKAILGPAYADPALLETTDPEDLDPATLRAIEVTEQYRQDLNLDQGLVQQYVSWLGDALRGDFGRSNPPAGQPISDMLAEKLPRSLLLMVMAQLFAIAIAIPIAVFAAYRAGGWFDRLSTSTAFLLISLPQFALGVILFYLFAINWQVFPSRYQEGSLLTQMNSLFLPAMALALPASATYARLLRTDLITTLQEDFVLMAKAKGMPNWYIMVRHALRPSTFSFVTVAGIQVGALIGGALVIERIFSIPGIGNEVAEAVFRKDYRVVQAIVLIIAAAYVVVNFLVEMIYAALDPRVRSGR